ncbi:hypothetical protein [Burkholderia sp. Ac-20365]|jgi:hypothetical protein|uniref:hypothetical protein n=1 Tax=Burkholderia sp. Ac-20365 TaxID=2703897 RepID=UPI00197B44CD|nr:hypothetical protein [Burkholderia sp. Ac-20365]MBN3767158.1 hypothetical protein [Burkholderia sp. Ac-20365]
MPRLRPLELVSRSLGHEWSLLPPNVSFRIELKALYAAMLRTCCLSAAAIRSMCSWDPGSLRQRSSTAPSALKPDAIALDMRAPVPPPVHGGRQWNTMAGGACAIGGAAVIAWLMASHPRGPASPPLAAAPDVTLKSAVNQGSNVEHPADAPLAWNPARGDLMAAKPADTTKVVPSSATAAQAPVASNESLTALREVDAVASSTPKNAKPSAIVHVARDTRNASPTVREQTAGTHRASHSTARAQGVALHVNTGAPAEAQLWPEHRVPHLPSAAGAYSPPAPSARYDSEYDSVTISARTQAHDIAPPAPRSNGVITDSTEWMNHMSQRRVTEVPDRFSK